MPAEDELWYPSVDDILLLHDDIVSEDDEASTGVTDPDRIEFAIDYVKHGHFGAVPETIHEKAFHLMRLLASNHWFVDGNKRTALNTTELFYLVNGYELDYGEDIRSMLKLFSVRESLIDREIGPNYLDDQTVPLELDDETDPWAALSVLLAAVAVQYLDVDPDEYLPDEYDEATLRDEWDLTTIYDGTVNNDGDEETPENGS
ncbi:type II toxin-antitoxin system death-on-curing family toxin [Natrinema versiforme]|uniref:Type II toxin-antitoxin system death-on-curing family toxin n=1 Tax=Natrinema versiforme TaxID=88724 RepID=A0A4P8WJL9_9EURY|nr:type II toxin-antitoxin system death-on-curing family toxin [Natrinema versiforme]QCS43445.1 type II toxin-antitoxin system death-on-curing family toxin [Natrinema versiforme]